MKKEDKEYCINNLASMCINELIEIFPNENHIGILTDFYSSKTYKKLCDVETRLWAEGPVYITDLYLKEIGKKYKK